MKDKNFLFSYHWDMTLKDSNLFAKTHAIFWERIERIKPEIIVEGTGAIYDFSRNIYRINIIDELYFVDVCNRKIYPKDNLKKYEFEMKVILVTYFAMCEGRKLTGEWVSEQLLQGGSLFFKGHHSLPKEKLIKHFMDNTESLREKCIKLGGWEIEGNADLSMEIFLLPFFPVRFNYFKSDEEFITDVNFLFDKNADKILLLDGILAIMNVFVKKLIEC